MTNFEKYAKVFAEEFHVTEEQMRGLEYQSISEWDSVGHMSLITAIEDTFGIMMDTEDIIDFSSFEKGMDILERNYQIEFPGT